MNSLEKEESRRSWSQAAEGWARWWEIIERGTRVVSERLIDLAGVQPGDRVLDVATGLGEPAVTASRRVGLRGEVVAIDRSPEMLAAAERRVRALNIQNIRFLQMDAERLNFPKRAFQAVLCRFGLMFFQDLRAALEQIHGVLAPGGRFAAAIWDHPAHVPMISLPVRLIHQTLNVPPPAPGTPGPFHLADVERLRTMMTDVGFTDVHHETTLVRVEFSSAQQYVAFAQSVLPEKEELAALPPERQAAVWRALAQLIEPYQGADGVVRFTNRAFCIVGARPPEPGRSTSLTKTS